MGRSSTTSLRSSRLFAKQKDYVDLKVMRSKRAAVFGVGQLGSLASLYLAKSGIGSIVLIDKDEIELRNTNVQLLYAPEDVGAGKAEVLARKLGVLAPWTEVEQRMIEVPTGYEDTKDYEEKLNKFVELLDRVDIALSCFDNIGSRVSVAKICRRLNIPMVDAGIVGKNGQVLATIWGKSPCIACLNLSGAGSRPCLLASTVTSGAIVAGLQASIATDLLHHKEIPTLIVVDLENYKVSTLAVKKNSSCWLCGGADD